MYSHAVKLTFRLIGLVGRVFANGPGDQSSIPGCIIPKSLKVIPPCLTLSNVRYISRVKWSNPGKGVAPSPKPRSSSYRKGSLLVTLDNRETTLLFFYLFQNDLSNKIMHRMPSELF